MADESVSATKPATAKEDLSVSYEPFQTATDDFNQVLAEVESMHIFAGPNADIWNRALAKAECRVRRELPKNPPE